MIAAEVGTMRKSYGMLKRGLDFFGAAIGLLLTFPIIVLSCLAIWLEDRQASAFIRQERIGLHEKPFGLIKLRTMRTERFRDGRKLSDDERMLRMGGIFRKLSIDELPQLFNVLSGHMSLIGPRPMPIIYLPYFRADERIRHTVRPGMSGLAQVMGRNFLTWDQKFAYDVEYVQHMGIWMDLKIFLLTLQKLAMASGVGTRGKDIPVESLHEVRQAQEGYELR